MAELDYYATSAQVFPVRLLAIAWESRYLEKLKTRNTDGQKIWKKPVIRVYGITLCCWNVISLALCVGVLAGWPHDAVWLRVIVMIGLVTSAATLLTRIGIEIWDATTS
jgi:hypothetical protein